MSTAHVLEARGLNRSFGGLKATNDVSFTVDHGTVTALIGPNGAGKTTVFNLVTNLFPADSGEIVFDGERIEALPPVRIAEMGLIRTFQTARVFPGMTVLENVLTGRHRMIRHGLLSQAFSLPQSRREERELTERADGLLDLVMLSRFRDTHATEPGTRDCQRNASMARGRTARPRPTKAEAQGFAVVLWDPPDGAARS